MWWSIQGWWEFHRTTAVGLLIAVLVGVGVMYGVGLFSPTQAAMGRITGFGTSVGRRPQAIALVRVDSRLAEVGDPMNPRCRIGSEIALDRRRSLIGPRYSVAQVPAPCGPQLHPST
jgi:hypothetical protein